MFCYAQIREDGSCVALTNTTKEIISPNMILIPAYNEDYFQKRYIDGKWVDKQ